MTLYLWKLNFDNPVSLIRAMGFRVDHTAIRSSSSSRYCHCAFSQLFAGALGYSGFPANGFCPLL